MSIAQTVLATAEDQLCQSFVRSGRPRRHAEADRTVSKGVIGLHENADRPRDRIKSELGYRKQTGRWRTGRVIISIATAPVRRYSGMEERSHLVFLQLHHCPLEVLLSLQCRNLSFRSNRVVWRCLNLAGLPGKPTSSRVARSLPHFLAGNEQFAKPGKSHDPRTLALKASQSKQARMQATIRFLHRSGDHLPQTQAWFTMLTSTTRRPSSTCTCQFMNATGL